MLMCQIQIIKNYVMVHVCIIITCILLVQTLTCILFGIFYRRWYYWSLTFVCLFICNNLM